METKLEKNLQEKVKKLANPVYIVFPDAHAGNIQDAIAILKQFPMIKAIPVSPAMIADGIFNDLIDSLSQEFYEVSKKSLEKQVAKGREPAEKLKQYNLEAARRELSEPLNLALMMVRKGYADAEVGGWGSHTAEHVRKAIAIIGKETGQKNIVCSPTVEFSKPHKVEDKQEGVVREQKFLTIVDPALGKASMEYSFLTGGNILKSLLDAGHIAQSVYKEGLEKISEEREKYIQSKIDQTLAALKAHYVLTSERPIGAFITHSTAGSDERSPYIRFVREEVIPAITKALNQAKEKDELLKYASFLPEEYQVEAASDPRIGRKKTGGQEDAGFVNVHVCASVVSANQHYKTFLAFENVSSIVSWSGFKKPVSDIAEALSTNDIALHGMIASISAQNASESPEKEKLYQKSTELFQKLHRYNILVINPGSTSTKVAMFSGHEKVFNEDVFHTDTKDPMPPMEKFDEHVQYRLRHIEKVLAEKKCDMRSISCIMGRGGLVDPLPKGGVYAINDIMLRHLHDARNGVHASNLGAHLASILAKKAGCSAYIADPVVLDERTISAKITGIKGVMRKSVWHALNQKYVAKLWAEKNGKSYYEANIIVAHMGGGLTVGAHRHGQTVDVNNGLEGDGVFSINRSGGLTPVQTMELLEKYGKDELYQLVTRKGGFASLLNTQDFKEILQRVQRGEPEVTTYYHAFVYQLAKQICSLLPAFYPEEADQLIFTGGMSRSNYFIEDIIRYLPPSLANNYSVYPGEFEMEALAYNGLNVLRGMEKVNEYVPLT